MPLLLVRSGSSRVSWGTGDAAGVLRSEFTDGFEARVSVYSIDDADRVKTYAEHLAGAGLGPRGGFFVDFASDNRKPVPAPLDDWPFPFTAAAHHELAFSDPADLETFIRDEILPSYLQRVRDIQTPDFKAYVKDRVAKADPEWRGLKPSNNVSQWSKLLKYP